ncbi:ABC transporter permease [Cryobacterium frigoriphilum]|uniref:ABC transporter permease n=1 Tax=Cryobacterium frigoriphilum TaxID=1259150 RepID=A0A4R9A161_9MICO|nr:ABC transporter permease [Cryobacterium frigoriphilum]TFD50240.1 ABC transporter permease [Cryobacterium frigoriphilum]
MNYLARKISFYVVALWAALTLNFLIPRLLPGNPVEILIQKLAARGPITPELRNSVELLLGDTSNDPIFVQYVNYLKGIFAGDFGVSITYYPQPVVEIIAQALPWTIVMIGIGTIIAFVVGITLGMLAGWKRGSWLDNLVPVTTMFQAVPYFWLALILLYVSAVQFKIFPVSGGYSYTGAGPSWDWDFISSAIYYGTLPALTIVISSFGGWLLGMRNMMVSTLSEDYIVTAEAKGLRPTRIMMAYAARNAILPSVAGFAISLGFVVSGSIVTEQVFSYPGVGSTLLQAVNNNDYSLMQGLFLVITLTVLGANLIVDLLYTVIDPRTRARS